MSQQQKSNQGELMTRKGEGMEGEGGICKIFFGKNVDTSLHFCIS